ncbi:MAG: phosphatase [Clostridiales bacterium]|nr:phosphatase [Clostridiales bacterium]
MKDYLDSHTHTLASGHAYSTINDNIAAAKRAGLSLLAITEHGPDMDGACRLMYFQNLKVMPRECDGLTVLFGAELNILNRNGDVDLSEETCSSLDVVIASIHPPCYFEEDPDAHLEAYLHVMEKPYVNIIGHPDDGRFPLDYKKLVEAAKEHHKLLEVNSSSLAPHAFRINARENYKEMLRWCREYEAAVVVNSDAHVDVSVGDHRLALKLLEEEKFPEELVVNCDLEQYFSYINYN